MNNNQIFNEKEYNTVVLGGLLHDIGKFLNRIEDHRTKKHPYYSVTYVSNEMFSSLCKEWVDIELLKTLCQRHHENPQVGDEYIVQKIEDDRIRCLAQIVCTADNYSSTEREKNSEYDDEIDSKNESFKLKRLVSIFSEVEFENQKNTKFERKYLSLSELTPDNSFPISKDEAQKSEYKKIYDQLGNYYKKFHPSTFKHFYNGLYSILEKFLWCVPSDASTDFGDISLFEHLSTTSAIAACLYQYHFEKNTLYNEEHIKNNSEKFILLYGDLSGIQKFIFNIKNQRNPKKLSKMLRGRSFMLGLIGEIISTKILDELNLPISCRILNAGGNFTLLLPNTRSCIEKINSLKKQFESEMLNMFLGELSVYLGMSKPFSGNAFTGLDKNNKNVQINFKNIFESVQEDVKREKNKPYQDELWSGKNLFDKHYEQFAKNGECLICGTYPKIDNDELCYVCKIAILIGEQLVCEKYMIFIDSDNKDYYKIKEDEFYLLGFNVKFTNLSDITNISKFYGIDKIKYMYSFNSLPGENSKEDNSGFLIKYISTYIPTYKSLKRTKVKIPSLICDHNNSNECKGTNCKSLCRYCSENGENCKGSDRPTEENMYLFFQCLGTYDKATFSIDQSEVHGIEAISILKADVDKLGNIFQNGLKDYTMSRVAMLSKSLNYFFTGYLPHFIKNNYPLVYIVYAGGDDLFLIGPWYEMISFVKDLRAKFKEYVAHNENLTFSAALHLMKPWSPISLQVEYAEEALKHAKEAGRNRLTIFNTVVEWNEIDELIEYSKFLYDKLNDENSKFSLSFIYRLLKYHKMYLDYKQNKNLDGIRFHHLMHYDIERNIKIYDKDKNLINKDEVEKLEPLYKHSNLNEKLMSKLNIPLFITIYKNRK